MVDLLALPGQRHPKRQPAAPVWMRWGVLRAVDKTRQLEEHAQIFVGHRTTEQPMDEGVRALNVLELVAELFEDPIRGRLDKGQRADPVRIFGRELEGCLASA